MALCTLSGPSYAVFPGVRAVAAAYDGETIFAGTGPLLVANGWSVFPQERHEGRRPARIDGRVLAWKPFVETRPTDAVVRRWAVQAPRHNVALILGPASGGVWCLDIDVTDEDLSLKIMDLATEILGPTPFIRVGAYPKLALFYRAPEGSEIRSRSYRVHDKDGEPTSHGVEILGPGKPVTVYGLHHKTGKFFKWNDRQPADETPDAVPLADGARIGAFLEAVERAGISLGNRTTGPAVHAGAFEVAQAYKDGDLVRPARLRQAEGVVTDKAGRIADGREAWVFGRARAWAMANPGVPLEVVVQAAFDEACDSIVFSGKWNIHSLKSVLTEKIRRIRRDLETGRFQPRPHLVDETGKVAQPTVDAPTTSPGKTLIKPRGTRKPVNALSRTAPDPIEAARRALTTDQTRRDIEGRDVADRVRNAARAWLGLVRPGDAPTTAVHLLKAPTGAGKTSTVLTMVADAKRAGVDFGGPIVIMMPSHANLEEGAARTRKNGGYDAFDFAAAEADKLAGSMGLKTLVYKGAVRGGCKLAEHKRLLGEAQIASGNLCRSVSKDIDGSQIERFCPHYDTCPVIAQRALAKSCDVILMPHAFLSLPMPPEITESARGLIIDEAVWSQLARTATFPLAALRSTRPLPRLTKAERKAGVDPETLIQERDLAVDIVLKAFERGECPAAALHAHEHGFAYAESARAVVSRTQESARSIYPGMPLEAVQAIASAPKSKHVWEEARFWRIIKERIESLRHDAVHQALANDAGIEHPKRAKGARDHRIQLTKDGIRISWRVEPNLARIPLLLMDASAERRIVEKLWSRPVVETEISAKLHVKIIAAVDKSWSDRCFRPDAEGSAKSKRDAARNLTLARGAVSTIALAHGAGHVLVGSTMTTREAIQTSWAEPDNCDFGHYGAFRGLDFANAHSAAFGIGRMELPIQVIDGLVAAFSYDDDEPEAPMDLRGDGLLEDGSPLRPAMGERVVRHRDGSDWTLRIQEHRGPWAKVIQRQYREEELRQFLGRLRPVYRRGEAPIVYVATNAIPEDWVVDEIVALEDLALPDVGGLQWTEAVRRTGVIDAAAWGEDAPDVIGRIDGETAIGRMGDALDDLTVDVRATVGEHDHPLDVKVSATVEDIDGTVREHLRRRGLEADYVKVIRDVERIVPAGRKNPDKIDAKIGSRRVRKDREVLLRERMAAAHGPADGTKREIVVDGRKEHVIADEAILFWAIEEEKPS